MGSKPCEGSFAVDTKSDGTATCRPAISMRLHPSAAMVRAPSGRPASNNASPWSLTSSRVMLPSARAAWNMICPPPRTVALNPHSPLAPASGFRFSRSGATSPWSNLRG